MIIYKDIIAKMKEAGYNTSRIRSEKILPESTLQRLRTGGTITTDTIDTLCKITGCRIEELFEYKEGNENDKDKI